MGASLAGLSTARALRSEGFDGRITLVGREEHLPYDRTPLSKDFLIGRAGVADLGLTDDDDRGLALDWVLGETAVGLNPVTRTVFLAGSTSLDADAVVIATGARARKLPGMGDLSGVHTLRTLDDAIALRADLRPGVRVVVVGAGFIGSEVAAAARGLGLQVTVVEAASSPLAKPLGTRMGRVCAGLHRDHGVRVLTGLGVRDVIGEQRVTGVVLSDGSRLAADVVVVAVGGIAVTDWLRASGLTIPDGVTCDADGATTVPDVFAVGDAAHAYHPFVRAHIRVEHYCHAIEQPYRTARALLRRVPDGSRVRVPYFWSDQYGVRIQFAGHVRPTDRVHVIEGSPDSRCFTAVYERGDEGHAVTVGVLTMNQPRVFARLRRALDTPERTLSPPCSSV